MKTKFLFSAFFLIAGLSAGFSAHAGPVIGNADVSDVTLNGHAADGIAFAAANGQAGPKGNPSVFNSIFTGTWDLLNKIDSNGGLGSSSITIDGTKLTFGFHLNSDKQTGNWTITSTGNLALDLVFAMHAGNATASFLFDNEQLSIGANTGTFDIDWFNSSGKNVPDYSNLTLFYKDAETIPPQTPRGPTPPAQVPEPWTSFLMLTGLIVMGYLGRRRKQRG